MLIEIKELKSGEHIAYLKDDIGNNLIAEISNTLSEIIEAAKKAMDIGKTKYTAGSGTLDLKKAICLKIKRENKIDISPSNILVSNGEKQSLSLACQALFQLGEQVLIF